MSFVHLLGYFQKSYLKFLPGKYSEIEPSEGLEGTTGSNQEEQTEATTLLLVVFSRKALAIL